MKLDKITGVVVFLVMMIIVCAVFFGIVLPNIDEVYEYKGVSLMQADDAKQLLSERDFSEATIVTLPENDSVWVRYDFRSESQGEYGLASNYSSRWYAWILVVVMFLVPFVCAWSAARVRGSR